MTLQHLNDTEKQKYRDGIRNLLVLCDREFVPPISSRTSTTQSDLSQNDTGDGISAYLAALMEQEIVCALDGDTLLGFVSYRLDHTCDEIGADTHPNLYVSTLIVSPESRGQGLTKIIYANLFEKYASRRIFTRTWSTNLAHIKILEKFGFSEHLRIKNHRGENIDTVYFALL